MKLRLRKWLRKRLFHLWLGLLDHHDPAWTYTPGNCEPCAGSGLLICSACVGTGWKDKVERPL